MKSSFPLAGTGSLSLLLLIVLLSGCTRLKETAPPADQQFGHRYQETAPDGAQTLHLTPSDSSVAYFYYPATFDSVYVRPAPFDPATPAHTQRVAVEVLVKGSFPDACTELHQITQSQANHIVTATLETRRPQGNVCASMRRAYRFYFLLENPFPLGNYTIILNKIPISFEVKAPRDEAQ